MSVGRLGNGSQSLIEPQRSIVASADLLWRLTTNWRAECRKSACSVRREGRRHTASLPYPVSEASRFTLEFKPLTQVQAPGPKVSEASRLTSSVAAPPGASRDG